MLLLAISAREALVAKQRVALLLGVHDLERLVDLPVRLRDGGDHLRPHEELRHSHHLGLERRVEENEVDQAQIVDWEPIEHVDDVDLGVRLVAGGK